MVLIGAGAGLSTAAGLEYGGKRFTDNFSDFIEKNNLTDMYSSMFYPYPTPEKIFATQGDYAKFQCGKACHDTLYNNQAIVEEMVSRQKDCKIPSELLPKC